MKNLWATGLNNFSPNNHAKTYKNVSYDHIEFWKGSLEIGVKCRNLPTYREQTEKNNPTVFSGSSSNLTRHTDSEKLSKDFFVTQWSWPGEARKKWLFFSHTLICTQFFVHIYVKTLKKKIQCFWEIRIWGSEIYCQSYCQSVFPHTGYIFEQIGPTYFFVWSNWIYYKHW